MDDLGVPLFLVQHPFSIYPVEIQEFWAVNSWNPNDPCFDYKKALFEGETNPQNKGQMGSRLLPKWDQISNPGWLNSKKISHSKTPAHQNPRVQNFKKQRPPRNGRKNPLGSPSSATGTTFFQGWFQGPPIMGPRYGKLPILFPYHSHILSDSYGNSMGPAYHKGVPEDPREIFVGWDSRWEETEWKRGELREVGIWGHMLITPLKINTEHFIMEVWFRSFSFLNGWFVGSMLIFQGVRFK